MPKGPYWTEEDDDYLEKWADRRSLRLIGKTLGRSEGALRQRLQRLGISAKGMQGHMTTYEVAAEYGTTHEHVKRLIWKGVLPATTQRGARRLKYLIWPEDAEKCATQLRDKGFYLKGIHNHKAKLTEAQVKEIHASKDTNVALAERYGVTPTAVRYARTGRTWKHLTPRKWYERH